MEAAGLSRPFSKEKFRMIDGLAYYITSVI